MTEELRPKRRARISDDELQQQVAEKREEPGFVSPMREPELFETEDWNQVVAKAKEIFKDETPPEITPETMAEPVPEPVAEQAAWTPSAKHFIDVQGGAKYLPARRRVQWMRQEPQPHPLWTIETQMEIHNAGTFQSRNKIVGGFAMFKAHILDEDGRLIATGHAAEYSENFFDFLEKAETSAVARALALAGYGTESALDIEEGFIADSPFKRDGSMGGDIVINGSQVEGLVFGGRSENATGAQIDEIRRRARALDLDPADLATMINTVTGDEIDIGPVDPDERVSWVLNVLKGMRFEQAAALVQLLMAAES